MTRQDDRIEEIGYGYLLRFKTDNKVFEVTYDTLKIREVSLHFEMDQMKVGSLYEEKNNLYAHLDSVGEDDFMGFKMPKSMVEKIIRHGIREDIIREDDSTVTRFIKRFDLDISTPAN